MASRNFKLLVPLEYLKIDEILQRSLKKEGQLSPVILAEGNIVDGIKRYHILKKLKKKIEFKEMKSEPFSLRLNLNLQRKFTLPEIAFMYKKAPEKLKLEILKTGGIPSIPEINEIFDLLLSNKNLIRKANLNKINISTLNDLIFWEKKAKEVSLKFSKLEGTFSELKNVSSLLRKAKIEGLENIKFKKNAKEMEIYLRKILYPNYSSALKKFKEKIRSLKLPKDLKIKEKDFFEEKELEIFINLNEKNQEEIFKFLFENQEKIKNILKEIP